MPIQSECKQLLKAYQQCSHDRDHNRDVLRILEGDLLPIVEAHIAREFSTETYKQIKHRISPINFLRRIVDKLSKIYCQKPSRVIADGTDNDMELLNWYEKSMRLDTIMNKGNEYYNAFNASLMQVYADNGKPQIRAVPNDRFGVLGFDRMNPTRVTHIMTEVGKIDKGSRLVDLFLCYTAEEIVMFDADGDAHPILGNEDGLNPFGTLGGLFMYVNRSYINIMPPVDSDTMRMTVLISLLLSDLNYATKFQSFSMIYTTNAQIEGITLAPNSIVQLKSDPGSDQKPELGQIKPQVDIQQTLELVKTQLTMWLNSKNIRPGSISDISADNMASGFSKVVDEMDTSEERKKQAEMYAYHESEWWNHIMHDVHPELVRQGLLDRTDLFSPTAKVEVSFPEQLPTLRRGQVVADLRAEVDAGFISQDTAMRKLNPEWSEERVEQEIELIEQRREIEIDGSASSENQDT